MPLLTNNAIKLNINQLKTFFPNGIENPIFLGVANDTNYVGLDLSNQNLNMDLWLKENEVIVEDLRKYGPSLNDIDASFLALTNGMFFGIILINFVAHVDLKTSLERVVL